MKVWRLQTKEGLGAYAVCYWSEDIPGRHPGPLSDAKMSAAWNEVSANGTYSDYYFGFASKAQLLNWFYSEEMLRLAADRALLVTVWEVKDDDCIVGHTQAVFVRRRAELIDSYSPLQLLDQEFASA